MSITTAKATATLGTFVKLLHNVQRMGELVLELTAHPDSNDSDLLLAARRYGEVVRSIRTHRHTIETKVYPHAGFTARSNYDRTHKP